MLCIGSQQKLRKLNRSAQACLVSDSWGKQMIGKIALGFLGVFLLPGFASAQTCAIVPFANGTTADADQLNNYLTCLAPISNPSFTGNVGIGTSAPGTLLTLAKVGSASSAPMITIAGYHNDFSSGSYLELSKSRGAAVGSNVATISGDAFGVIDFQGVNAGGNWNEGARIIGYQDDTDGATYVPGRLSFYTGTNSAAPIEQMRITSTGNVGVGTTSPTVRLHVYEPNGQNTLIVESGYTTPNTGATMELLSHTGGTVSGVFLENIGGNFRFEAAGGICTYSGGSSLSCSSDARIKTNFTDLRDGDGLQAISRLRPVRYSLKRAQKDGPQLGFIAQEVRAVLPEAVMFDAGATSPDTPHGSYLLNYSAIIPSLVKAVQQQQAEIAMLKQRLSKMEGRRANRVSQN